LSTGKYLGTLDSDDMLAPTALQETAAVLTEAAGRNGLQQLRHDGLGRRVIGRGRGPRSPIPRNRLLIDFMTFHFRLMRRELFESGGMDSTLDAAEDYDLCLKISELTQIETSPAAVSLPGAQGERVVGAAIAADHELERGDIAGLKRRGLDREMISMWSWWGGSVSSERVCHDVGAKARPRCSSRCSSRRYDDSHRGAAGRSVLGFVYRQANRALAAGNYTSGVLRSLSSR